MVAAHSYMGRKSDRPVYFMSLTVASSAFTRPAEQALLNSSWSIAPSLFESIMAKFSTKGVAASLAIVSPFGEAILHAASHLSAGTRHQQLEPHPSPSQRPPA